MAKKIVAVSVCKGLDEKGCGGNKACGWITPKDPNDKTGKLQTPYCRKVAGVAAKKPVVKAPMAAKAATAPAPQVTTTSTPPPAKPATAAAAAPAKAPAPAPAQ